jgi:altronate dehydratase
VTANPAVHSAPTLVRAGATVMFSEVTEVRDGIDQLTSRAINADVAEAMIRDGVVRRVSPKASSIAAPIRRPATRRADSPT